MNKKICFIGLFILVVLILSVPSFATFRIDNFVIDADVLEDGTMEVTETIDYYTDEVVNGLIRDIKIMNSENRINSATGLEIKDVLVDGQTYEETDYASKGDKGVFTITSLPERGKRITLYTPFSAKNKTVQYSYILENVPVKYDDTAELFWNFLGSEWDCKINKLTVNVNLPEAAAKDTIWVYGHGSDKGTFNKTDNHITLNVYSIPAYNAIDARILFSRDSINNDLKTIGKSVLPLYIEAEEGMATELEAKLALHGISKDKLAICLTVIVVAIAVYIYIFYDKEDRIEKVKYFREIPYGLEPEVLQYIYYGKAVSNSFYIAVLNLIKLGVYKLENTINDKGKETQRIVFTAANEEELKDYQLGVISTINGFLEKDEEGKLSLEMNELAKKMSRSTGYGFKSFQDRLKTERENVVGKPKKAPTKVLLSVIMAMAVLILIIVGITAIAVDPELAAGLATFFILITTIYSVFFSVMGNSIPVFLFLLFHAGCFQFALVMMMKDAGIVAFYPAYLIMFILIQYVQRVKKHPVEERQIKEYVRGLKRYMKHYSMLKEKEEITENIVLWEDYFIMSIALGLNKKTINYFYNYGKEQVSNLGTSMSGTHSYTHFHHDMYNSLYRYQRAYVHTKIASSYSSSGHSSYHSSGSHHSGSSGGFSGGHSSGGHGGGGGGGSRF